MNIRSYVDADYDQLMALYDQSDLYGGQRDENRDSSEKIREVIARDPEAIIVADDNGKIVGTVSLIENGRVAWLFRFAVLKSENEIAILGLLQLKASGIFKARGHNQMMVYSPAGNGDLDKRYETLNFNKGNDYTAFWQNI